MSSRREGFTLVDLLIATAITTMVAGAVLGVILPMQRAVQVDGEAVDLHQRLRAAADALSSDVRAASAVRPYRVGALRDDSAAGIFYRADTLTAIGAAETKTYYFRPESSQLMIYDGAVSDFPMIEHVTALTFDYFGGRPLVRLDPAIFLDGPWLEDRAGHRFDEDNGRIRLVRVFLRLESTAPAFRPLVRDEGVAFDIARRAAGE